MGNQGGPEVWRMVVLLVVAWAWLTEHSGVFVPCGLLMFHQKKVITWMYFDMLGQAKRQSFHP